MRGEFGLQILTVITYVAEYIYWQCNLHNQQKAKHLETELFYYEENLMAKLKQIFNYWLQGEFLRRDPILLAVPSITRRMYYHQ